MGELAQLVTSIATLLGVIGTLVLGWRNTNKIAAVDVKVEQVHLATNSLQDKLVASTAKASHAEGVADEKARADAAPGN